MAVMLSACAGGGDGGGSVDGTIDGASISVVAAVSTTMTMTIGSDFSAAVVLLSNDKDICSHAIGDTLQPDEDLVELLITNAGSAAATAPTTTGTFNIATSDTMIGPIASFNGGHVGSDCSRDFQEGSNGTVTLTGISNDVYSGTFDVTLLSGDHVTGSFDPVSCPGLMPLGAPSCQ